MSTKNMADMIGMMSGMMGGCKGAGMKGTPEKMTEMIPRGLNMMLSRLPEEKRAEVLLAVIPELIEKACSDMAEQKKTRFVDTLIGKIKPETKKKKK